METLLSIFIGIGLSAACGFRIFVPLLIMSTASLSGFLELTPGFEWIGTYYAFAAFLIATILEVFAYYIPWLDNLLDSIVTPAAVIAGIVATASVVQDISPFLKWSLAIIAGGGVAGAIQMSTVALRGGATITTGGTANQLLATAELAGSATVAIISIIAPIIAVIVVLIYFAIFLNRRLKRRKA